MKLLKSDAEALTFELDRRERELMVFLLRRYPVLDPAWHQIASPGDRAALAAEQEMLTESMTAEQVENRGRVEKFIESRLDIDRQAPVRITRVEAEWLLRVINDVRVGCWVRLGAPDESAMHTPALAARSVTDYTAMELGGLVQSILLAALDSARTDS